VCNSAPPSHSSKKNGSIANASSANPSIPINIQSFAVFLGVAARLPSSRW